MSSKYDIKCKVIEEELRSVWPEWHVAKRLGGGAFGDVFQIYRDNHGIRVDSALKVIQVDSEETAVVLPAKGQAGGETEAASQSDIPDALLGEIQIMEALRGAPNIVAIEDFSIKKDGSTCSLFVRMELLTSLQEILLGRDGHGTLSSIREIVKLGRDICTALMHCEKKGIIHRDIKPANLFVDGFGHYKVGDFGASKRMDTVHVAQTMTGIGTISYMAPEIFRGRSYNNTVDIYALGLVLYQLLNNGRMPFLPAEGSYTTQDIDSANYQRLHGVPVPSLTGKTVGGEMIDSRLDAVVRRACAMNPADRYQSAKEFYDALALTETAEKKPVPVYAKRPQGSLAPAGSLQNREQERARQEPGIKPPVGLEPAVLLQGRQQEKGRSGPEVRPSAVPPPERSSASEIAGYYDEMIGWREVKDASAQKAEQKQTKNDTGPEIDRKNSVKEDYGPEIDRKNPGGSAEKKSGGFKELYFYEKVTIILLPATIIAMIVMSGQEGFYDRMMNYNDALGFNTYRCCYFVPLIPFILSLGVSKRKLRDRSNTPATILTIAVFAFIIFSVLDFFSRVNLMNQLIVNSEQYYVQSFRLEEDMFMGLSCFLLAISMAVHRIREKKKANKA